MTTPLHADDHHAMTAAPSPLDGSLLGRMRSAVLALELAPGQRLSERGLEPRFSASRTPVRAALMRLESEGLVQRDGKNWQVTPLDAVELAGLYEYRGVLEPAAVRLAARRAASEDLNRLAGIAHRADADENPEHTLASGTDFHREVARLSGNAPLLASMEGVLTRLYRTRWLEVQSPESRDRANREHREMAKALLAGDAAGAEAAMVEHLRGTRDRMLAALEQSRPALRANGFTVS